MSNIVYKLKISFFGKKFLGWQIQKEFSPTVQGELNKALKKVFKSDDFTTTACGRTDSGVHAKSLLIKLVAPFKIESLAIIKAINSNLDEDIRVTDATISKDFNPTYDAKSRSYFYLLTDRSFISPFEKDYIASFKRKIDIKLFEEALSCFVGEYDFINYMCVGSNVKSTRREIFSISVRLIEPEFHGLFGDHIRVDIEGNGFLKQMIRLIIGTCVSHAQGKITLEEIKNSLLTQSETKLAPVAPANGLYKESVSY